jgi:hypothetical protein
LWDFFFLFFFFFLYAVGLSGCNTHIWSVHRFFGGPVPPVPVGLRV